jgi:site-specific DNA-methyltransferase (adenine-specific)
MSKVKLFNGDCLEVMDRLIEKGIKVDAIITDIPYGTTSCKWDSIIPLDDMWKRLNNIVKDKSSPIVLFGAEPFTSQLVCSNIKNFKWKWYYKKLIASNFASAKYQPMKHIEDICVFTKNGDTPIYLPIMQERSDSGKNRIKAGYKYNSETPNESMGNIKRTVTEQEYDEDLKFPENIQTFNNREKGARGSHPTQKPISLMEYLIKSHTKEGDFILDFTMGSGTTGVACVNTNRNFIGIELDENYFNIAKDRIEKAKGAK